MLRIHRTVSFFYLLSSEKKSLLMDGTNWGPSADRGLGPFSSANDPFLSTRLH